MIDLHCHILPGVDDGSPDLEQSHAMARMAVEEGVTVQACTPHMFPGVYNNRGDDVRRRVAALQVALNDSGVPLKLVTGADVHITPDLVSKLKSGEALSLNDTRYVLIETPHHVLPPRVEDYFFNLLSAGFVPILTHPERMSWIDRNFDVVQRLVRAGALMQLTAGALTGGFGKRPKYWSERMLDERMIHIVATDAHDTKRRPPRLQEAIRALVERVGAEETRNLVLERPRSILENRPVSALAPLAPPPPPAEAARDGLFERLTGLLRGKSVA